MSTDWTLKSELKQDLLLHFSIQIHGEYPEAMDTAINTLMLFGTTYLSKKYFLNSGGNKNKTQKQVKCRIWNANAGSIDRAVSTVLMRKVSLVRKISKCSVTWQVWRPLR